MIALNLLGDLAPAGLRGVAIDADSHPAAPPPLTLANLELPFCSAALAPATKAGPSLRCDPQLLPAFAAAWPGLVVTLANNHAMDFGAEGLTETLAAARATGLQPFGAGATLVDATAPLIVMRGGMRLGLLAATDRWFGVATSDSAGVCPLDPGIFARIRLLRESTDRVIVSVHGGGEMSPWPSPSWQQRLRSLVEAGADVVHGHHPHLPLGWERWQQGWIFYGLGNTLVNPARWATSPAALRSWRVQLDLADPVRPPRVAEWECRASAADTGGLRCVRSDISATDTTVAELNGPLTDPPLLEGLHQEYALRLWQNFYADRLNPGDTGTRRLRLAVRTVRDTALAAIRPARWARQRRDRGLFYYHLFSAATHAEEIATALGVLHGELPDRRNARTHALAASWLPAAHFPK
ncbi:MAG: hypothetical protein RIQ93_364 [Verrucomicrobiota bacterium]|jgi:poly-gamma-glutamate synthesis protein (capsule biosynthesis protein)